MALPVAKIVNVTRGSVIAEQAELARTFAARGQGLLGRTSLQAGAGLVIDPEWSIHMLFMRFPIDVLFVNAEHRIVELPIGVIAASGTQIGDQIRIEE